MQFSRSSLQVAAMFAALFFLASCGGGGSSSSDDGNGSDDQQAVDFDQLQESIKKFDQLSDSVGFIVTGSATGNKPALRYASDNISRRDFVDTEPNSIYAVKSDGRLEKVTVTDENDNQINRGLISPALVMEATPQYLIIWFFIQVDDEFGNLRYKLVPYLVNKASGFAYNALDVLDRSFSFWQGDNESGFNPGDYLNEIPSQIGYNLDSKFVSDNSGNIYYRPCLQGNPIVGGIYCYTLVKVDTSNLGASELTVTQLQNNDEPAAFNWDVDGSGEFLVFFGRNLEGQGREIPYFLDISTGDLTRLTQVVPNTYFTSIYKGLDNQLYIAGGTRVSPDSYTVSEWNLYRIDQNDSGDPLLSVVEFQSDYTNPFTGSGLPFTGGDRKIINGKVMYISGGRSTYSQNALNGLFEFDHTGPRFVVHDLPSGGVRDYSITDGNFYLFGIDQSTSVETVYRYNPFDKTTLMFPTGLDSPIANYDISKMRVLSDSNIWVEAFDLSTSTNVLAELNMDDFTVEVIDATDGPALAILSIQAISPADFVYVDGSSEDWSLDLRVSSDALSDAPDGFDLAHYSQLQNEGFYFGLVEFADDQLNPSEDHLIRVTLDGSYSINLLSSGSSITTILGSATQTFIEAGAVSGFGNAIEFRVPLSELSGIGSTPVVSLRNTELAGIELSYDFSSSTHTISATLPRTLESEEKVTVDLNDNYDLEILSDSVLLVTTGSSTDISSDASGLGTTTVEIAVSDSDLGSPGELSPTSTDKLELGDYDQM